MTTRTRIVVAAALVGVGSRLAASEAEAAWGAIRRRWTKTSPSLVPRRF